MNRWVQGLSALCALTVLSAVTADAADFFGASVDDKSVPSAAWAAGIIDITRPTVGVVAARSVAAKNGLRTGAIILSINGFEVIKSADLARFDSSDTFTVKIWDGLKRATITFDRSAPLAKKATAVRADTKESSENPVQKADMSPTVVFSERRGYYLGPGRSGAKKADGDSVFYGDKTLADWGHAFRSLCYQINQKHDEIEGWSRKIYDSSPSVQAGRIAHRKQYEDLVESLNRMILSAKAARIPMGWLYDVLTLDHDVENLQL